MEELTYEELVCGYKQLVFRANLLDPYSSVDRYFQQKVRGIIYEAITPQLQGNGSILPVGDYYYEAVTSQTAFQIESHIDQLIIQESQKQVLPPGVQNFLMQIQNLVRSSTGVTAFQVIPSHSIN